MKYKAAIFILLATQVAVAKNFKVGIAFQLKQEYEAAAEYIIEGIETAKIVFEKRNPGKHVELKKFSFLPDLAVVVETGKKLAKLKLPAVIGAELSEEALALGEELEHAKTVLITPTASNPRVTESRPYVFQTCANDTLVADKLAQFAKSHLSPESIGVFQNISSPYSDYLSRRFRETYMSGDIRRTPILVEKVLRGALDLSSTIEAFAEKPVSLVTMFTEDEDLLRFVSQSNKRGFAPVYLGADGWGPNQYVYDRVVNEIADGSHFVGYRSSYWKETTSNELTRTFQAEHRNQFHHEPNAWAALGFDTGWILFTAAFRAKNPMDGTQVQKELTKIRLKNLVTSSDFSFGKDNAPARETYVFKISKEGVKLEATLK